MGRKLESRYGPRLNTRNFIKTPSRAIVSVDYSSRLKVLEVEYRGNPQIYHYKDVKRDLYQEILKLKKNKRIGIRIV